MKHLFELWWELDFIIFLKVADFVWLESSLWHPTLPNHLLYNYLFSQFIFQKKYTKSWFPNQNVRFRLQMHSTWCGEDVKCFLLRKHNNQKENGSLKKLFLYLFILERLHLFIYLFFEHTVFRHLLCWSKLCLLLTKVVFNLLCFAGKNLFLLPLASLMRAITCERWINIYL